MNKQTTLSPATLPYLLVNDGIDTLVLNLRYTNNDGPKKIELPEEIADKLDLWQAQAREEEQPVAIDYIYHGENLFIHPHGAGKGRWRWLLTSSHFNLTVSRGRLDGIVLQVRLSAALLWSTVNQTTHKQNVWPLLKELQEVLACWFAWRDWTLVAQVSEVHLCADLAGWDLEHLFDWQATMVSRARRRRPHGSYEPTDLPVCEDCQKLYGITVPASGSFLWQGPETEEPQETYNGHRLETIDFGSHGSPLSCAIYNKTKEIKHSGKFWMPDIWKLRGYDGVADVWRVELRWKREALHEIKQEGVFHGIETLEDLRAYLPYLWTYGVGHTQGGDDGSPDGWIRHVIPTDDATVSRWPVSPAWQVVQSAFWTQAKPVVNVETGEVISPLATLIRQRHRQGDIQRLVQQIAGCASTLAARLGGREEDLSVDLSAYTENDTVPVPDILPIQDLETTLLWLLENAPRYALKEKLPPGAPDHIRLEKYLTQFEESVTEKRVLYGLQSTEE